MTIDQIKRDFDKAMFQIYVRAEKEANYRATAYYQMLNDYGGFLTAKKLIAPTSKISDGYTALWERGRLDLTVEALIVQQPWISLFGDEEISIARKRLKAFNADPRLIEPNEISHDASQRIAWSKEALERCVSRYSEALYSIDLGRKFDKAVTYQELSKVSGGHSDGSVRNLFQNISYELDRRGLKTIPGIAGRPNSSEALQAVVASHLDDLLTAKAETEVHRKEAQARHFVRLDRPPAGNSGPQRKDSPGRPYFIRDIQVSIYIKAMAVGKCELCEQAAPFHGRDGAPYLEIHHIRMLADGGPDVPSNTVALCPNCHKAIHLGANSEQLREILYSKVNRLIRV